MAETTKFQANFKLADGTLVNVYADSAADFESQLATLQDTTALIHSVSQSLGSAGPTPAFQRRSYTPKPAGQGPIEPPASGETPQCSHGEMQLRTGTSAKGPWKGWMCAAPKGVTPKCDTIWVR